jgi:ribosome-binding protein aMBF1 (putative translation factor)
MSFRRDKKKSVIDDFRIEDLFDNEEEREKLEKMNEIQRETYIADKRHK